MLRKRGESGGKKGKGAGKFQRILFCNITKGERNIKLTIICEGPYIKRRWKWWERKKKGRGKDTCFRLLQKCWGVNILSYQTYSLGILAIL